MSGEEEFRKLIKDMTEPPIKVINTSRRDSQKDNKSMGNQFREYEQHRRNQPNQRQSRTNREQQMRKQSNQGRKYSAKKGTAKKGNNKKRKARKKLAALILSGMLGIGGIALISTIVGNNPEPISITQIQQEGADLQKLGLTQETLELFEKYDEYFEEFDKNAQDDLKEEQVLAMIYEIRKMHFSTVKEKMGTLVGEEPEDIRMYYSYRNGDGTANVWIEVNGDEKKVYKNNYVWPFSNEDTIPSEVANTIEQLEELENLVDDVKEDKITKINAVKKLEKYYEKLEKVATGEFTKDENRQY